MASLVMNPQQPLCSVYELVVNLRQGLSISKFLWVFDYLVENGLVFLKFLLGWIVILPLEQFLD